MELPEIFQAESLKRLAQSAALGCAVMLGVGFGFAGWLTGGEAAKLAENSASKATVAIAAPICVENFQRGPEAADQLAQLKRTSSWQQGAFIEKGGWAMMSGAKTLSPGVAQACASLLNAQK